MLSNFKEKAHTNPKDRAYWRIEGGQLGGLTPPPPPPIKLVKV